MVAQTEFTKIWEQGAEAERNKILGQLLISQGNRQGPGDATSGSSPGGKGWRKKGQPNRDQGQGASPGRVYRAPGNLPPTLKELQDAQNKESPIDLGQLQEEGYGDEDGITSLQIQGSPSFDIDPNKKPQTESQKRRADKLRDRKMRGGEGSEQAGNILDKLGESGVGLPNFIENINPRDALMIIPALLQLLNPLQGQMADASALTDHLDSAGRNQRTGSFRGTPLGNDPKKLIETLLIGKEKYKA